MEDRSDDTPDAQVAPPVPFWVQAALSTVSTPRGGFWLIVGCVLGVIYCLPWPDLLGVRARYSPWYLAPDWSWSVLMLGLTGWYTAAVAWMNRHGAWPARRD